MTQLSCRLIIFPPAVVTLYYGVAEPYLGTKLHLRRVVLPAFVGIPSPTA